MYNNNEKRINTIKKIIKIDILILYIINFVLCNNYK